MFRSLWSHLQGVYTSGDHDGFKMLIADVLEVMYRN